VRGTIDPPALEVRALTGPAGAVIIADIDMVVPHGAAHVVLGPIHSGKSMLMRHLLGLERAISGTIRIEGELFDATNSSEAVLRRLRTRIGAVFEGSALLSRLTAVENVELPLLEHTEITDEGAREAAQELLAEVGMRSGAEATPAQLGRAEQRRVALARALALRPAVLLLDEPSLGLDPHAAAELDALIARIQEARGCGVVIFSHEVRYAFGRAEYIYVMSDGVVVEQGNLDAIQRCEHPVVRQLVDRRGAR
jgi:phospholipid/cholesterol/gamma-HCH transport system ATP-binding protein